MTVSMAIDPGINKFLPLINHLSSQQRLSLAKLLLESVLADNVDDESEWQQLSLKAFEEDWDNTEDAIYDNWKGLYGVSTR